jgi:hypothetical protein
MTSLPWTIENKGKQLAAFASTKDAAGYFLHRTTGLLRHNGKYVMDRWKVRERIAAPDLAKILEALIINYDVEIDPRRAIDVELRDQCKTLLDEWCVHFSGEMDAPASQCLDEIQAKLEAMQP